jgi:hypothetical protein
MDMKGPLVAILIVCLLVKPVHVSGQALADSVQLQALVVRAIRNDETKTPMVLVYENVAETGVTQQVGALTGIPVRRWSFAPHPALPSGDTIAVRVKTTFTGASSAIVTVDSWGRISRPSKRGPTSWFVRKQADVARQGDTWTLRKLTTLMES